MGPLALDRQVSALGRQDTPWERHIIAEDMEELINQEVASMKEQPEPVRDFKKDVMRKTICEVVDGCKFCVTVRDPDDPDFPLVAVSDGFLAMTEYTRDDILGVNCRFLYHGCPAVSIEDLMQLRLAGRTGQPFSGLLPTRRRSGELFVNFVDLRGLTVGYSEDGRDVWYLIGIQADVTGLDDDEIPTKHLDALREMAARIREKLKWEFGQFALAASDGFRRQESTESMRSTGSNGSTFWKRSVTPLDESRWIDKSTTIPGQPPTAVNEMLLAPQDHTVGNAPSQKTSSDDHASASEGSPQPRCHPRHRASNEMLLGLGLSYLAVCFLTGLHIGSRARRRATG